MVCKCPANASHIRSLLGAWSRRQIQSELSWGLDLLCEMGYLNTATQVQLGEDLQDRGMGVQSLGREEEL